MTFHRDPSIITLVTYGVKQSEERKKGGKTDVIVVVSLRKTIERKGSEPSDRKPVFLSNAYREIAVCIHSRPIQLCDRLPSTDSSS